MLWLFLLWHHLEVAAAGVKVLDRGEGVGMDHDGN
jgi:hypothetical protein